MMETIRYRMYRIYVTLFFVVMGGFIPSLHAQGPQDLFEEANRYFRAGEWAKALETYDQILRMDYENGPLYFNIGNCHYKLQNIGQTILYYEKARKWLPGDADLEANLALANLSVVDKIEPIREFILFRIFRGAIHFIPHNTHVILVLIFYSLCIAALIGWLLAGSHLFRRWMQRATTVMGILFILFGVALVGRWIDQKNRVEAVILSERVDVMSGPTSQGGIEVFTLHEGTKVRMDERTGEWVEIVLADGKVGWVKQEVLGII